MENEEQQELENTEEQGLENQEEKTEEQKSLEDVQEVQPLELDETYKQDVLTTLNNITVLQGVEIFLLFGVIGALVAHLLWSKVFV